MEMGYETTDFIKFAAEDSGNVADDGNYSVQVKNLMLNAFPSTMTHTHDGVVNRPSEKKVLAKVLSSWNVELIPLTSPDLIESKKDPTYFASPSSHFSLLPSH